MTHTAPGLTDDDLDALRQIAAIDWTDTEYTARLARSLAEGAQHNAALRKHEKRTKATQPNLFAKGGGA